MAKALVTLGIDLGGTKIDIGVVDASGEILRREIIKTSKAGAQAIVSEITDVVARLISQDETIIAAGVGMAGQIEAQTGLVHFAPNLGWKDFPLGRELEAALKCPVKVTNDVRAAAWGEWLYGAGKGCDDLICVFVGTGIGAGVVSGGKMLAGATNTAGEVGHMTLEINGPLCSCGNKGCFEALVSGWAIAARAKEAIAKDPDGGKELLDYIGGAIEDVTAKKIFEAYKSKLPVAIKVIEEAQEALVAGMANLINIYNPSKIILGGGIITGSPFLIDIIRSGVPKRALKAPVEALEIVQAKFQGDAGVIGASAFALDELA